jgi:hypothetical protein
MNGIVFALILFCVVLLVVSLIYITSTMHHKERMALLDKDKDPDFFKNDHMLLGAIKWGLVLFCGGAGFMVAFLLNYFVFPGNDGEPVFPAMLFLGAGTGLMVFYKLFKNRK